MDRFDAMRVFTRIVERRSFTQAADDLGLPRSSVTDAVKGLEARLGVRLLQRTTRQVSPTLDGEAYYQRCVSLIADMEDAEGAFVGAKPSGLVRVDVHGTQARHFLLPGLPRFRQQYPDIRLHFSEAHQPLDMIREGFDCILRAGELSDSPLIKRRLALLETGHLRQPGLSRPLRHAADARRPRRSRDGRIAFAGHRRNRPARLRRRRQGAPGDFAGDGDGDRSRDQRCVRVHGPRADPGAALSRRARSWPAARWSRCSPAFRRRRCPSTSSTPTRGNCRRACGCSSTGWPSSFATGSHRGNNTLRIPVYF